MDYVILIVEDDPDFSDYLQRGLTYAGYRVQVAPTAEAGLEYLHQKQPDAIILDVMLPGMDGLTACRRLRDSGHVGPVLMLTARDAVNDRVTGLDAGADDYLVKPFAFDELLARLRALLRRKVSAGQLMAFADLEIDTGLHLARRGGKSFALTRIEYALLTLLLAQPRQALSRDMLIERVWGTNTQTDPNLLDVYISRLRHKLGEPQLIHTLYGVGYVIKEVST